ncbi:MAG: alkane 1-monooxygenase [Myxococcota bacterium]
MTIAKIWARHLACFVVPLASLAFVLTGPHHWYGALPFLLVIVGSVVADFRSGPERRQPLPDTPAWPFDLVLYALVAIQVANVVLLARMIAAPDPSLVDAVVDGWVGIVMVGVSSGYSGIVVAHELIHRKENHMRQLGRLLLVTVAYEHFYTEHVRGHHKRVGTPEDPATARFGETFPRFKWRTIPAQFKSAWNLEKKRLGRDHWKPWKNRVSQGVVAEIAFAAALGLAFGPWALLVHLIQAHVAVTLLECVNYFEHWGLVRRGKKVTAVDSWDTDSAFTYYTLVGLSRHADHHALASRPYQDLRHVDESPKLPVGYFGMVVWILLGNSKKLRARMTEELERRRLGPFADTGAPPAPAEAA